MNNETYLDQSARTVSDVDLHYNVFPNAKTVLHQLVEAVYVGVCLDAAKRALFYKDDNIEERVRDGAVRIQAMYEAVMALPDDVSIPQEKIDILHAALGIGSENGEIIEELLNSIIQDRPVDVVNMQEENGDLLWYIALSLRKIKSSFGEVMQKNIDKLFKRYPEKFDVDHAVNRDLDEEQRALNS